MSEELKPCPFCGGKASHVYDPEGTIDTEKRPWRYTIVCDRCCASTGLCWSDEMAIKLWNRRANDGID